MRGQESLRAIAGREVDISGDGELDMEWWDENCVILEEV